jgi:hypothetical protein
MVRNTLGQKAECLFKGISDDSTVSIWSKKHLLIYAILQKM